MSRRSRFVSSISACAPAPPEPRCCAPRHARHAAADQPVEQRRRAFWVDVSGQRVDVGVPPEDRLLPAAQRRRAFSTDAALPRLLPGLARCIEACARRGTGRSSTGGFGGLPHGRSARPHGTVLQLRDDRLVASGHRVGHRLAEFAAEDLLRFRLVGDLLDRLVQRTADDAAAQRVALGLGVLVTEQRARVAVELAQLVLTAMRDQLPDALERDALFDLVFAHQADRLPVSLGPRRLGFGLGQDVFGDAFAQRSRQRIEEQVATLEDVDLGEGQLAALAVGACRLHEHQQGVRHFDHRTGSSRADLVLSSVQCSSGSGIAHARWQMQG